MRNQKKFLFILFDLFLFKKIKSKKKENASVTKWNRNKSKVTIYNFRINKRTMMNDFSQQLRERELLLLLNVAIYNFKC